MNEKITGQLIKLSRDCPKPDNWFSGVMRTQEKGEILVRGKPGFPIEIGMKLSAAIIDMSTTNKGNDMFTLDDASIERIYPSNERTIISFLSGPDFKGVGRAAAQKLFDTFGADVFEVIKTQPDRLTTEAGITEAQKSILVTNIMDATGTVMTHYPQLRRSQAINLLKFFDNNFKDIERAFHKNVYGLIGQVKNFDFDTADRIFLEALGKNRNDKHRLCCILKFVVENYVSDTGHNYVDVENGLCYDKLVFAFSKKAGIQFDGKQMFQLLHETDENYKNLMQCTLIEENGLLHLYLNEDLQAQNYIAEAVRQQSLNFPVKKLKKSLDTTLMNLADPTKKISPEQKMAAATSLAAGLSIIKGGPGRGKSMLMDVICHTWRTTFANSYKQADNIILIAPTGRAAKNLTEKTGLPAVTAARLVVCRQLIHKIVDEAYIRNQEPKFDSDKIHMRTNGLAIVDECSMIGTRTMGYLLQILVHWFQMQVILVGDPEQLPAIENGAPFADMIDSNKIPVSTLTVNFRTNGKDIMDNADKVCRGDTNLIPGKSFHTTWFTDNDSITQLITSLYYQKMGINPSAPTMPTGSAFRKNLLLCPLNKGTAGAQFLNSTIQDMLNPETPGKFYDVDPTVINSPKCTMDAGYAIPGTFQNTNREHTLPNGKVCKWTRLRVGDRVVNTENNPDQRLIKRKGNKIDGEELYVEDGISNGDRGVIVRYTKAYRNTYPSITVKLDNGMFTDFFIDPDDPQALKLQLGYALTVHKAQGSEAETVIICMPCDIDAMSDDMDFATRNLLNTAVTRAINESYLIGSKAAVDKCILNPARKRDSTLADYL